MQFFITYLRYFRQKVFFTTFKKLDSQTIARSVDEKPGLQVWDTQKKLSFHLQTEEFSPTLWFCFMYTYCHLSPFSSTSSAFHFLIFWILDSVLKNKRVFLYCFQSSKKVLYLLAYRFCHFYAQIRQRKCWLGWNNNLLLLLSQK